MVVSGGSGGGAASTSHSLRMRGLPYQADEKDVEAFFEGFKLAKTVVVRKNGKPTGEGYVYFHSEQEASAALQRKNRESMGNRYIELFLDGKSGLTSGGGVGGRNGSAGVGNHLGTNSGAANGSRYAEGVAGGVAGHGSLAASHSVPVPAPVPTPVSALHSGMTYAQASRAQAQAHLHVQDLQLAAQAQAGAGVPGVSGGAGIGIAYPYGQQQGAGAGSNGNGVSGGGVAEYSTSGGSASESNSLSSTPPNGGGNMLMRDSRAAGGAAQHQVAGSNGQQVRPVVVRVRGLPFSAQERDVRGFFEGQPVKDIVFTLTPNGRPTGEAFVEFMGNVLMQNVLSFQKQMLGKRYIEIFKATKQEFLEVASSLPGYKSQNSFQQGVQGGQAAQYQAAAGGAPGAQTQYLSGLGVNKVKHVNNITGKTRMLSNAPKGTVLKLRGLPYTTEEKDIRAFFTEYGVLGVVLMTRPEREGRLGTCNGVAYVQFSSSQEAEVARQTKHKEMMGNRYIECMTHIPKGTPLQGQHEGVPSQEKLKPQAEPGSGTMPSYPQHQMALPLQAANAENGDFLLPNDFFRNIKTSIPQYYGAEDMGQNRSQQQVWPTNAAVVSDGKQNGMPQAAGPLDQPYNMPTLQQQLEKMGLSEKGESLFSAPVGGGPLLRQQQQGNVQGGQGSYVPVGGAPPPPGYGPDPWATGGKDNLGLAKAPSDASSPEDPLGNETGGNANANTNGNGSTAAYSGWSSGIQNAQEQGFTAGYSPILDSRFKHLW
ncbi:splicing ribonucleoprotein [Chloropicon primus]|uniref:Splicing ribonucleoprotein n=1 Tax=Chloropicon primus TaxID=1764295 RepID=A0A5B8MKL0_9CHLO|nr:splicing ribonucleoprotein [Chloropicon primus]UPQ99805.1 splicing ribonucleoprotein [Chloropicon primus]|eukprot:QDZ20594.1 splicing ribonucleoprotein [Chloropicon primus]